MNMSSIRKGQTYLPRELLWLKLSLQRDRVQVVTCNYVVIRIHQKSSLLWYLKGFRKAFQRVCEISGDLENTAIGGGERWSFKGQSEGLEGVMVSGMSVCCFYPVGGSVFFWENLSRQCLGLVFPVSEEAFWRTVRNGYWKCTGILDESHSYFI